MMIKKIIVIGSGYSGSGAVFDYLINRPDILNPFRGREMRLIQDPDGLLDLYTSCFLNFTLQGTSNCFNRFIECCDRIIRTSMGEIPGLRAAIDSFVKDVTAVEYRATPYCQIIRMNWVFRYFYSYYEKLYTSRGKKPGLFAMRIPVEEKCFLEKTREFMDRIIDLHAADSRADACAINHGGSFWHPVMSTEFYSNRKVVIVTRDARDVYAEVSRHGRAYPGRCPETFCSWYSATMSKINADEWQHPDVLVMSFEEFVNDHENAVATLTSHAGLDPHVDSSYDSLKSAANIGKFNRCLSDFERKTIERELKEYCYL